MKESAKRPRMAQSLPGRSFSMLLALLLATACSCNRKTDEQVATTSGMQRLDAAQAKAALSGNTAHGIHFDGKLFFYASFHHDATMKMKLGATPPDARNAEKASIVLSTWRLSEDGRVCIQPKSIGPNPSDAKETCVAMYRQGSKFEWFGTDGKLASSGTIDPGLREDL